jgi:hypothetical protein
MSDYIILKRDSLKTAWCKANIRSLRISHNKFKCSGQKKAMDDDLKTSATALFCQSSAITIKQTGHPNYESPTFSNNY